MTWLSRWAALPRWQYYVLCLIFGAAGALGHAPYFIWPVTWLTYALLFWAVVNATGEQGRKSGFGTGFMFGFGYFLANIYWVGSAFIARGPEFIPIMPPMVLGLAAILGIFWGATGLIIARYGRQGRAPFIAAAAILYLAEYARGNVLSGFPWALPGYIFEGGSAMSQSASLFGIYGLSLLVLLSAALAARGVSLKSGRVPVLMLSALLLAGNYAYGSLRLRGAQVDFQKGIALRIVQVPFDQKDQMDYQKSIDIVNLFLRETNTPGLEHTTHLIWPEGAVVGDAFDNAPLMQAMSQLLLSVDDTPPVWLLNSLRVVEEPDRRGRLKTHYYNSSGAVTFDADGSWKLAAYNDKAKLVPFGEFVPGGELVEDLGGKILSTSIGSITPAKSKVTAHFPGLPPLSPQICYEIIFSGLTPRPPKNEAPQFILNQSNDAWFGRSVGPWQHANIATFRAIETGLPIVRSASNGVSGVIDPYGRYLQKTELQSKVVLDVALPHAIENRLNLKRLYYLLALINLIAAFICARTGGGTKFMA